MNLQDKRVIQTRSKIRKALLGLMQKKPASQITVTQICGLANINQNTFYAHYNSPADILEEIELEYYETMQRIHGDAIRTGDMRQHIVAIMETLRNNREFSIVLYSDHNDVRTHDRNYQDTYARIILSWIGSGTRVQTDHLQCLFLFLTGGMDAMIKNWVQNGMREDPSYLAEIAGKMCDAACTSIFNS